MYRAGSIVAAVLMMACGAPEADRTAGMANPASTYCIQLGGTITLVNRPGGQIGFCTLPDGTHMEEWELYKRDHD